MDNNLWRWDSSSMLLDPVLVSHRLLRVQTDIPGCMRNSLFYGIAS